MKTKVFKRAHRLAELTGKNFSVCLARSWALDRLVKEMQQGNVSFAYERADGTLRKATGTLKGIQGMIKGRGQKPDSVCCYYDVKAKAFRSFRIENFITVYPSDR